MERGKRIELSALAWKAKVLPLYEPRILYYNTLQYDHNVQKDLGVKTLCSNVL